MTTEQINNLIIECAGSMYYDFLKSGTYLEPDVWLEMNMIEITDSQVFHDILTKYEDDLYAGLGENYDTEFQDMILVHIGRIFNEIVESLEDVRNEYYDRRELSNNPWKYYGVSKSNFYGV